jgi:hypothetical protein
MSSSLGISSSPSRHHSGSLIHQAKRNFLRLLGFEGESDVIPSRSGKRVLRPSHSRGFFPSMPRDYLRRRRVVRRISNIVLVVLLSVAFAYGIVHISGPGAFSAPHP